MLAKARKDMQESRSVDVTDWTLALSCKPCGRAVGVKDWGCHTLRKPGRVQPITVPRCIEVVQVSPNSVKHAREARVTVNVSRQWPVRLHVDGSSTQQQGPILHDRARSHRVRTDCGKAHVCTDYRLHVSKGCAGV